MSTGIALLTENAAFLCDSACGHHARMPELPDITAYLAALESRIVGRPLLGVRLASPFLLRTAQPPLSLASGRRVRALRRLGKRIAIGLEGDLWLVLHLMIAGRLHWRPPGAKLSGRSTLAAFDFDDGSLVLTEAGTKRRASLHVAEGRGGLEALDPGGIDVLSSSFETFKAALVEENRTLKRALTDPRVLSGIGNAYSDEILHAAQPLPAHPHSKAQGGRVGAAVRGHARYVAAMDRPVGRRDRERLSRKSYRLSRRDGRARPLWQAVSALPRSGAAHPLRRQRDELLCALPDRRQAPRGSRTVATARCGLAAHAR
jgi:formamidopyrimidine-DNA glycosylase